MEEKTRPRGFCEVCGLEILGEELEPGFWVWNRHVHEEDSGALDPHGYTKLFVTIGKAAVLVGIAAVLVVGAALIWQGTNL